MLVSPHMTSQAWHSVGVTNLAHQAMLTTALWDLRAATANHKSTHGLPMHPQAKASRLTLAWGERARVDGVAPSSVLERGIDSAVSVPFAEVVVATGSSSDAAGAVATIDDHDHQEGPSLREQLEAEEGVKPEVFAQLLQQEGAWDSPEHPGTGPATTLLGRGITKRDWTTLGLHTVQDEAKFPIGQVGTAAYDHLHLVHYHRGLPWQLWHSLYTDMLPEESKWAADPVVTFLELANPHRTGLMLAAFNTFTKLREAEFQIRAPKAWFGSLHDSTTRGNALMANKNKLIHDRDQLQYLVDMQRIPRRFQDVVSNFTAVIDSPRLADVALPEFFLLSHEDVERIGSVFQRFVCVGCGHVACSCGVYAHAGPHFSPSVGMMCSDTHLQTCQCTCCPRR